MYFTTYEQTYEFLVISIAFLIFTFHADMEILDTTYMPTYGIS